MVVVAGLLGFMFGVLTVVGYLYSTGSTLKWSPSKKA